MENTKGRSDEDWLKWADEVDFNLAGIDDDLNRLSRLVIGAAIEVHRVLGPGFLESVYERALCLELRRRDIPFVSQPVLELTYKGEPVGEGRIDLLVDRRLVVELKAVEALMPVHSVQLRSYLKATSNQLGLLINFNVPKLRDGLRRVVNLR